MSFLNPWVIAIAGGLTIPPLVALYFLKLKRQVKSVPSTLLWRKAIEDLHVNAPFQRLRSSLLLILQLLALIAAAVALGKPMLEKSAETESTVIFLIDQSASMNVVEPDGRTRLQIAKEEARQQLETMPVNARAMVISFCDRGAVVSSFDTDRRALERKIDSIEPTDGRSTLSEAISLAEAYADQVIIEGREPSMQPEIPTTVFLFTDGRIEDTDFVALRTFEAGALTIRSIGSRSDNVGIVSMEARRSYDRPERLEVAAAIRNFGPEPVSVDAVLHINGQNVAIRPVTLTPGLAGDEDPARRLNDPPPGSLAVATFGDDPMAIGDYIEYEGGGVVEVSLRIDDALPADNRAYAIIDEPREATVLLVSEGNPFIEHALSSLRVDFTRLTPAEYEQTGEDKLVLDGRSRFDAVMIDRHDTARLPQGSYFFWGCVPKVEGVSAAEVINDEIIFNWDETHPLLRYIAPAAMLIYEWQRLELPGDAVTIMEGESSPVLASLQRDGSRFLISAFSLIVRDEDGVDRLNTDNWVTQVDFIVFMQNAVQFLSSNVSLASRRGLLPGEPVTIPLPANTKEVTVRRPDGTTDVVPVGGHPSLHYARTRNVGLYAVSPTVEGQDRFAVNLYNAVESLVAPAEQVSLGASRIEARTVSLDVNRPAWHYFLLILLGVLVLEWIVYNRRVFV